MSVTSWWDEIVQLTGTAVPTGASRHHLADELLGGAWWLACERAAVENSPWLAKVTSEHPALQLLRDWEPGAEVRALAASHAADAGRRLRFDIAGDEHSLATAACLWAGDTPPDDLKEHDLSEVRERWPDWGWASVDALASRVRATQTKESRTIRLTLTVPDGIGGSVAGNLCVTPNLDGKMLADPVSMMFADIDCEVTTEIEHAWHWAVNRDRFRPGSGCTWTIVNDAGRPLQYVPPLPVGAVAVVALGFAFHLLPGTRREPRRDTLVVAGLLRSGAFTPIDGGEIASPPGGHRVIVHPRQDRVALPTGAKVRTAETANEAIRYARRPRYILVTVAVVMLVVLVTGLLTEVGAINAADTEKKATASLAARLAVEAEQQYAKEPDRALQTALASYRLAPDSAQAQAAVLQAMYRDARFGGVLPALPGTLRALAVSDYTTAAGMDDGTVALYDETNRLVAHTDKDHTAAVRSLVFSPDSRLLASSGDDGTTVVRDMNGRTPAVKYRDASGLLAFSPDSRLLAIASDDGTITVHDLNTGTVHTLDHRKARVDAVNFVSPTIVAVGGADKMVVLYDVTQGKSTAIFTANDAITSVTSDGKGERFLFTDSTGDLHYADPRTKTETHPPERVAVGARALLRPQHGILIESATAFAEFPDTPPTGSDGLHISSPVYPAGSDQHDLLAVSPNGERIVYPSATGAILQWRDPQGNGAVRRIYELTGGAPVAGTDLLLIAAGGFVVASSSLALVDRNSGDIVSEQHVDPLNGGLNMPVTYGAHDRVVTALSKGTATIFRIVNRTLVKVADLKPSSDDGSVSAITIDEPHRRILVARQRALSSIPIADIDHPVERLIYHNSTKINRILPFPDGHDLGLTAPDGLTALPVSADGFVTGNGQRLSNQFFVHAIMPDADTIVASTPDGSLVAYRRENGVWSENRMQGDKGFVYSLAVFENNVVSTGRDNHVIVSNTHDGHTVVDIQSDFSLPLTAWRDGDNVRVSRYFPQGTEMVFALEPAAAAAAACKLGGWRGIVGDVARDASRSTQRIPLCPNS